MINAVSKLPYSISLFTGENHRYIRRLHQKYGDQVRIAPEEVSYANSQSFRDIYGLRKGIHDINRKDVRFYIKPLNGVHWFITAGDADHARARRIFSPAFSERSIKEQEPLFLHTVDALVSQLNSHSTGPLDFVELYNYAAFDVMADLTFGESMHLLDGPPDNPWRDWVEAQFLDAKGMSLTAAFTQYDPIRAVMPYLIPKSIMKKHHENFENSAARVDKRLATQTDRPDLWSLVLRQEESKGLSREEMHSNAALFMMAGTETVGTVLGGLTFYLLRNPQKLGRLTKEIRVAFKEDADIEFQALTELPYLRACISEGLRLFPPVPSSESRRSPTSSLRFD
ncbi:MAG: hypothetical protein Q9227_000693 [Pyrenula ochraceoflavens]